MWEKMPSCALPTSLTATPPPKRTTSLAGAREAICRSESKKRFLVKTQNASFIFSGNVDDCVNVKDKKIRRRGRLRAVRLERRSEFATDRDCSPDAPDASEWRRESRFGLMATLL